MRGLLLGAASIVCVSIAIVSCRAHDRAPDTTIAAAHSSTGAPAPSQAGEPLYEGDTAPPWLDSMLARDIKFDSPRVDSLGNDAVCYVFPKYIVVAQEFRDSVGSNIVVRRAQHSDASAKPDCRPDSLAGDFYIRNEFADYYAGLDGHWLILDNGTGPERGVILYDVETRAKIPEFIGDVVGWRDTSTLVVWRAGGDTVARAVCAKIPESLGASTDSLMWLSLPSGRMTWAGHWRCAARQ